MACGRRGAPASAPFRQCGTPSGGRVFGQALILLHDLTTVSSPPSTAQLRDLFGLTRAEAEIAGALSGGATRSGCGCARPARNDDTDPSPRHIGKDRSGQPARPRASPRSPPESLGPDHRNLRSMESNPGGRQAATAQGCIPAYPQRAGSGSTRTAGDRRVRSGSEAARRSRGSPRWRVGAILTGRSWRTRCTWPKSPARRPSTDPVFLAIVGVHVLFGLTAVITGAVVMLPGRAVASTSEIGNDLLLVPFRRVRDHERLVVHALGRELPPVHSGGAFHRVRAFGAHCRSAARHQGGNPASGAGPPDAGPRAPASRGVPAPACMASACI